MRAGAIYGVGARKQTVSLSINGDLLAKAKAAGINLSRVAEAALTAALAERLREEMRRDIAWIEAYEVDHGSFPDLMRADEEAATGAGA